MTPIAAGKQIGKTLKNAARLRTIVSVFAKHGFHNIAERVKLGKFILERLSASSEIEKLSIPVRMRMSFEELGPTFVKLGQVLATRPDLIPQVYVSEFEKLQYQAQPLPFETIEQVLKEEFGNSLYQKFSFIDKIPLGSASIAQVHKATLISGEEVVLKVQRPGIIQTINDDLNVLYFLAELLHTYVPETRPFNPTAIVDEFFKTLELETNFIVEANNIRRFQQNFKDNEQVIIPKVYMDLVTERVLTMEALSGIPLSYEESLRQPGVNSEQIMETGLRTYMKMVFIDGLFHGDLHAGNFFVFSDNRIGLIDFGVVGRLNQKTQAAIANMLIALSREDYERMAYEYVDLAPFTEQVNVDVFAKQLRELIAPYFGLTLKNVNLGKVLMSSSSIAAQNNLSLPTELMMFFKSIVAIEGMGRRISQDFDFLKAATQFAGEIVKHRYEPTRLADQAGQLARESKSFLETLPRQLNFLLKKINSPTYSTRVHIQEFHDFKKSLEASFNLLFLGIVIAALIIGSSLNTHTELTSLPTLSLVGYLIAAILGLVAFINYIKKP
ncbi:MAG: ABC1 kinase family protein [Bdellovibrionia bacterium]